MLCAYTVCAGAVWHGWHHQGVLHPLRQEVSDLLQRATESVNPSSISSTELA